jgi:hypothetical protein
MGRLVRKPQVPDFDSQVAGLNGVQSGLAGRQMVKADPGDGYLELMVKYVPAEIIAFSMVINAILEQAMKSGGDHAAMAGVPVPVIAAVALVVACLLTPLFCWYVRQDGDAWVTNAVYLMGAVAFAPYHDGNLAAILVMSFTVVSGLVAPRADKPKLREQPQEVATPERLPAVAAPERLPEVAATERPRLVVVLAG